MRLVAGGAANMSGTRQDQSQEFLPVVLAGGMGNRMFPLVDRTPKCLLPVANRPMLSFQLEFLQQSGFSNCLIITSAAMGHRVKSFCKDQFKGDVHIDIVVLDALCGTCDALRDEKVRSRIKTDFFVISADIVTNVFLHHLADIHRSKRNAAVTVLLKKQEELKVAGSKKKMLSTGSEAYIGIDSSSGRLVVFRSASDVETGLVIHKSVLRRHPKLKIHTKLMDAHLYLFSRWVLDLIADKPDISSIQGELLPYLVQAQYTKSSLDWSFVPKSTKSLSTRSELLHTVTHAPGLAHADTPYECYAHVADEASFLQRCNTVQTYFSVNRTLSGGVHFTYTPWRPLDEGNNLQDARQRNSKIVIGDRCMVGRMLTCHGEATVKNCTVGDNVTIGKGVKLSNCLVMSHVTIEEACSLSNSIICSHAKVGAHSVLKDSRVGEGYQVPRESELKSSDVSETAQCL